MSAAKKSTYFNSTYFNSMRKFLNFYFKAPDGETRSAQRTRLATLKQCLLHCEKNYTRIGEGEQVDVSPEVKVLLGIQPIHIARWLKDLAYHTQEPSPDERPEFARSSTLQAHKRNISYYMPLNKVQWDPINHRGNPTKADVVNKTIERVVQFELKGKGAHAQDARALEFAEFQNVIQQSRTKVMPREQEIYKYVHTAFRLIQYHLCARTDDIVLLDTDEIRSISRSFGNRTI